MTPDGGPRLVCPDCGRRQDTRERCDGCGYAEGLLSLDDPRHVDLLRDIDEERMHRHEKRVRLLSVGISMLLVFALWCVPGFWKAREQSIALPFLADQFALMIVIGIALTIVLKRTRPKPRFPYIDS